MKKLLIILYFLSCSIIIYGIKPDKEYYFTPEDFGLKHEVYKIETSDGYTLNSWHILAQDDGVECTVILSGGDSGNMSSSLMFASTLSQMGFDVLLYDYRGFGQSDDFEINQDMLYYTEFADDLLAVVNKAKMVSPKNRIALFGLSMGSIINTLYYQKHPENVDFLIADGFVYSVESVVERIKERSGKDVLLPYSETILEDVYDNIEIPFLLFFASDDHTCNSDDLSLLREKIKAIKVISYDGGHLEGYWVMRDEYIRNIIDFLGVVL